MTNSAADSQTNHCHGQVADLKSHGDDEYGGPEPPIQGTKRRHPHSGVSVADSTRHVNEFVRPHCGDLPEQEERVATHDRVPADSAPNVSDDQTAGLADAGDDVRSLDEASGTLSAGQPSTGGREQSSMTQQSKPLTGGGLYGNPSDNNSSFSRKRGFSNRTKTGCLTCRRRKKKCDETRPKCNNCTRSGHNCLQPNSRIHQRALIQAKRVQVRPPDHCTDKLETASHVSQPSALHNSGRLWPDAVDNGVRTGSSIQSGSGIPPIQSTYCGSQWPHQPERPNQYQPQPGSAVANIDHPQHHSVTGPRTHRSTPPASQYDNSRRPEVVQPCVHPVSNPHQYPVELTHSIDRLSHQYRPPPPYSTDNYQGPHKPSSQGRILSTLDHCIAGRKTVTDGEIERWRMLHLCPYNHIDAILENERARCERALVRYNNACEWDSSVSRSEIRSMLEKVVDPSHDNKHHYLAPCEERGFVRAGSYLERPFRCTYGYNLKILEDVFVGADCLIDDAATVEIGPRTWIGPGVIILTSGICTEMVDRKGMQAKWFAKPVTIAAEVVIGAYARIFPGVTLERGVIVEPFAVVKHTFTAK